MKKLLMVMVLLPLAALADVWTDPDTGIEWTYRALGEGVVVCNNEKAVDPLGIGIYTGDLRPTVPESTEGAVIVPSKINGMEVVGIEAEAFRNCGRITSVSIPTSVTNVCSPMFTGCRSLTRIDVSDGNKVYVSIDGLLYSDLGETLVACPPGASAVELSANLRNIGYYAASGCGELSAVAIPPLVTNISNGAFSDCKKLRSVALPAGLINLGGWTRSVSMEHDPVRGVWVPRLVETCGVFEGCLSLEIVNFPVGLKTIGGRVFRRCKGLKAIQIPDSVEVIMGGAFSECLGLSTITLPSRLRDTGGTASPEEGAFFGCSKLTTVTVPAAVVSLPNYMFAACTSLQRLNLLGDKPSVAGRELLMGTPPDMIVNVSSDTFGWYDPINYGRLARWQGRRVGYDGIAPSGESVSPYDCDVFQQIDMMLWNLEMCGITMTDAEKRDYFHSIQDMIEEHPELLESAGYAVQRMGIIFTQDEKKEFARWSQSITARKLNPPSESPAGGVSAMSANLTVTNVVIHYVLNSIQPDIALPVTPDTGFVSVLTEVKGGSLAIPDSWTANYPSFAAQFGSDFAKALMKTSGKVDAAGNPMMVWQDYVAGTDPTNPDDKFMATITLVDGVPVVSYTPELTPDQKALRRYTTYGKVKLLDDNWIEVPSGREAEYNFFKVTVEMR